MIENCYVSVDAEQMEDSNVLDYFFLQDYPGEFLVEQNNDGDFYFICNNEFPIETICKRFGWYLVSSGRFNEQLKIGMGLAEHYRLKGWAYRVQNEWVCGLWSDILKFTFEGDFLAHFYPYNNQFQASFTLDGDDCYYIHDYYPVSHSTITDKTSKQVVNLVLRFKEGRSSALVAKIFALAILRMPFYKEAVNPIIIPIAASTRERQSTRFASFTIRLANYLKVQDGFRAIWIREDREQYKGTRGQDKIANLDFNKRYIKDKTVFLIDDVITSGESFIQIKRKLYELGARSVVGLFLARTVQK